MPLSSIVKDLELFMNHPQPGGESRYECSPALMNGGAGRDRTGGLRLAKPALSQLSYSPAEKKPLAGRRMVGLSGVEPLTSRLSGGRSNQLSYRPTP